MADLSETLDLIRAALRRGDYASLPDLARLAEAQMLSLTAPDAAALHALRARAQATGACLMAAANGIRAAERRLAELREGAVSTYDPQGRRHRLSAGEAATRRY